jgi:hypothetical protein
VLHLIDVADAALKQFSGKGYVLIVTVAGNAVRR